LNALNASLSNLRIETAAVYRQLQAPMTSSRATTDDGNQPMTAAQAGTLKRLAQDTYELDAFKPNLTRAEAEKRIITLTAKLKLLGEPPHTL